MYKNNNGRLATLAAQVLHVTLGLFFVLNVCWQTYDLWFFRTKREARRGFDPRTFGL